MDRQLINRVETDSNGRQIVTVSGVIDLRTADTFANELNQVLASITSEVVVDLRDVEFLDSTGVTALMRAGKALRTNGGELVLVCATGPVRRVLEVSGVDEVFRVVASQAEVNHEDA
ncbi:MAG: STAS domain-containing protein [Acidimicrobiia bacterium]|nr:STAS domain-containing protein [Acidimicrobiia bacterium]NNF63961.1 STAS domain-containing protein [Acidimicrobiia bacterium]